MLHAIASRGAKREPMREPAEPRTNPERTVVLDVEGMTCASCEARLARALSHTTGVKATEASFALGRARVRFDPATVDETSIAAAIEDAGFVVPPQARSGAARGARARDEERERAEEVEQRTILRDFLVALALGLPVIVLGMAHGAVPHAMMRASSLVQAVLATAVLVGPGRRFPRAALAALRHRSADMNTLVALGASSAWLYSTIALATPGLFGAEGPGKQAPHLYYEAAVAIVTFVLLGKLLETRARARLASAVRGLVALTPKEAVRVVADVDERVPVERLARGDLVRVRPGERVPADGVVVRGTSALDEAFFTGESMPVDKREGDAVLGGSLNQVGALVVRITEVGDETALARIASAVAEAQASRAPIARLADRVSGVFVPAVLVVALLAGIAWAVFDRSPAGLSAALEHFVAVLVLACPCALGLATPAAIAVATGRGAELGILVKGGEALEDLSRVDMVLVDKTGTLTEGTPELTDVVVFGADERELLRLAASAERGSEHPVGRAIVTGAHLRGVTPADAGTFVAEVGSGIRAQVEGHAVRVGRVGWTVSHDQASIVAERLAAEGKTPLVIEVDGEVRGVVAVADTLRADAGDAVRALRSRGIEIVLVTGDHARAAEAIARQLGLTRVVAGQTPAGKARVVAEERARGRVVAMVGDGVNDAPALAAAHVGIAIGHGADVAVAAADVTLLQGGIGTLPRALGLARATFDTIRRNLVLAFVYNVVGIPIAAGVLQPWTGLSLSPVVASAAMSLSSVSVLTSSLRLRAFGRRPG